MAHYNYRENWGRPVGQHTKLLSGTLAFLISIDSSPRCSTASNPNAPREAAKDGPSAWRSVTHVMTGMSPWLQPGPAPTSARLFLSHLPLSVTWPFK